MLGEKFFVSTALTPQLALSKHSEKVKTIRGNFGPLGWNGGGTFY